MFGTQSNSFRKLAEAQWKTLLHESRNYQIPCRAASFHPVLPDEPSTYYRVDRQFHKRRTDRLDVRENLSHPLRGTRVPDCGLRTRVRHRKLEIACRGLRKLSADNICPSDPYLTFHLLHLRYHPQAWSCGRNRRPSSRLVCSPLPEVARGHARALGGLQPHGLRG